MKRRGFFGLGVGLVGLLGLGYLNRNGLARAALTSLSSGVVARTAPQAGADVCILTPEMTAGPYYIKSPLRADIAEARPGLPLKLAIEIVTMPDCMAAEGVMVEVWHCDAAGYYSGYSAATVRAPFDTLVSVITNAEDGHIPPVDSEVFMRGGQITDARGMVEFETVFPGWYDPRVTHIHVKVSQGDTTFVTTQLYFTDALVNDIYTNHPDYMAHGTCPYNLDNDSVLRELEDQTAVVLAANRTETHITASARFGIA